MGTHCCSMVFAEFQNVFYCVLLCFCCFLMLFCRVSLVFVTFQMVSATAATFLLLVLLFRRLLCLLSFCITPLFSVDALSHFYCMPAAFVAFLLAFCYCCCSWLLPAALLLVFGCLCCASFFLLRIWCLLSLFSWFCCCSTTCKCYVVLLLSDVLIHVMMFVC